MDKRRVKVTDPLDDGFGYQHTVAIHRMASERHLHVRRCFSPRDQACRLSEASPSSVGKQTGLGIAGAADDDSGAARLLSNHSIGINHSRQRILLKHGVVVEPQIEIVVLADGFGKGPTHAPAPKQVSVAREDGGVRPNVEDGFRCSV